MHANERKEIKEVRAGDIAAAVGLKEATTGDTLCDPTSRSSLERMIFPEPVISQAVEPKTKADQEKMGVALNRLAQEDPSFRVHTDEESRPDDHLRHGRAAPGDHRRSHEARVQRRGQRRQAAGRVPRDHPQAGREVEGKFVNQSGGRGQYGHVVLKVEPNPGRQGLRVRRRDQGRRGAARVHSRRSRRACTRRSATACSPAIPWWT